MNEKKNKKEPEIFTSLKKFVELAEKLKETMIEYDNLQSLNEKNNCSENQKKNIPQFHFR